MVIGNYEWRTQEENDIYEKGYRACYDDLKDTVKRLGKKYYKEFLLDIKDNNKRLYSETISNHKCNCEYCTEY